MRQPLLSVSPHDPAIFVGGAVPVAQIDVMTLLRIVAGIVILGVSALRADAQFRDAGVQPGTPPGVARVVGCYDSSLMAGPFVKRTLPQWVRLDSSGAIHTSNEPERARVLGIGHWYARGVDSVRLTWAGPGVGGTALQLRVEEDALRGTGVFYGDMPHTPPSAPWPVNAQRITCPAHPS